jgi:DNA-damage-inducible protein J
MPTEVVRARIDPDLKRKAILVLNNMGLSVSDAIRLTLIRVVEDQAMPFQPRVPNVDTQKAMQDARDGNSESFSSVEALFRDLHDQEDE